MSNLPDEYISLAMDMKLAGKLAPYGFTFEQIEQMEPTKKAMMKIYLRAS